LTRHDRFCRSRQITAVAFAAWLEQQPPADAVFAELDATASVLRQLAALVMEAR